MEPQIKTVPVPIPKPILSDPDSKLKELCKLPTDLSQYEEKGISQQELEMILTDDAFNLLECREKHKALLDFYSKRDKKLREVLK